MKCAVCGFENAEGSVICEGCGAILGESNSKVNVDNEIQPKVTASKADVFMQKIVGDGETIPFFLQGWFIFISMFIPPIFLLWAIILLVIRLSKFPKKRKSIIIGSVITIVVFMAIGYFSGAEARKNAKTIKTYTEAGEYDKAIEYIKANYNDEYESYYSAQADVYEKMGDYEKATSVMLEYVDNQVDLTKVYSSTEDKLGKYRGKVSDETREKINDTLKKIAEAKGK